MDPEKKKAIDWMENQLDGERIAYCEAQARDLTAMGLRDEETGLLISYSDWLYEVTRQVYMEEMRRRSQYCGEMGEQ